MTLCVYPNCDLELEIQGEALSSDEGEHAPGLARRYVVVGPKAKRVMLDKLLAGRADTTVSGPLSPLHPINLPPRARRAIGIPAAAAHFAFCYPADGMEAVLEALNLTDQPWAFLLLLGGFLYFDADYSPCGINSLTLAGSSITLDFLGPFDARSAAVHQLDEQKRLCEVTLDALEAQGFVSFCWVHPHEEPGGERLHHARDNPFGGFVYTRKQLPPIFYTFAPTSLKLAPFDRHRSRIGAGTRGTGGGAPRYVNVTGHSVVGLFVGLAERVQRDLAETHREHLEVQMLVTGRVRGESHDDDEPAGVRHIICRWGALLVRDVPHWLRFFAPVAFGASGLLLCGAVAQYDRGTYEVVATFVWSAMYVEITWAPLRDTAGLAILHHSKEKMRVLYAILMGTPPLLSLLTLAFAWAPYTSPGLETRQGVLDAISVFMIYLAVPISLHFLRRLTAAKVHREVGLQARTVSNLIKWRDANVVARASEAHAAEDSRASQRASQRVSASRASAERRSVNTRASRASRSSQRSTASRRSDDGKGAGVSSTTATRPPPSAPPSPPPPPPLQVLVSFDDAAADAPRREASDAASSPVSGRMTRLKRWGTISALTTSLDPSSPKPACPCEDDMRQLRRQTRVAERRRHAASTRQSVGQYKPTPEYIMALRLQAAIRRKQSRRRVQLLLRQREVSLLRFSWPIFLASLIDIIGTTVLVDVYHRRGALGSNAILGSLILPIPAILVLLRDLRRKDSPRFSLTHCIFFVAVLYRLSHRAAQVISPRVLNAPPPLRTSPLVATVTPTTDAHCGLSRRAFKGGHFHMVLTLLPVMPRGMPSSPYSPW